MATPHDQTENSEAVLLLAHHQYFSAFEGSFTKPAQQLAEVFGDQEFVWLWGHEHRFAVYNKHRQDGGISAYGRCVGHGGMPVEEKPPTSARLPYGISTLVVTSSMSLLNKRAVLVS